MILQDDFMGRIEVRDVPLPDGIGDFSGTYTCSGRVLVSARVPDAAEDTYRVFTVRDDGTDLREVFCGQIPQLPGANGVRWMCFEDNQRILLGDYVLECAPDVDDCREAKLIPLRYPEELDMTGDIFRRWSEIIIAPDNRHMCWTTLTWNGAVNYLGCLNREAECYTLEDVCIVSTVKSYEPDPMHEGFDILMPVRGGEVKQFILGGKALTMVGGGDSITESVIQYLDSEDRVQVTSTPGYEETTIFSPDNRLGVVMSPRFSTKTNCSLFGLVPQPCAPAVRNGSSNILYMYCVSGVREFRKGNVGPVLIDIEKSCREGRNYQGVDLSDPEGRWVYYSPISWHPDGNRAMWNEGTRPAEGERKKRLRICCLLDRKPSKPLPACETPHMRSIPYALPFSVPKQEGNGYHIKIKGKCDGYVVNQCVKEELATYRTIYHDFSNDGETYYNGSLTVTAPSSMFAPGETRYEADLEVSGGHTGEMKFCVVFRRESAQSPAVISFEPGADGQPKSRGWSSYDGETVRVCDMEP